MLEPRAVTPGDIVEYHLVIAPLDSLLSAEKGILRRFRYYRQRRDWNHRRALATIFRGRGSFMALFLQDLMLENRVAAMALGRAKGSRLARLARLHLGPRVEHASPEAPFPWVVSGRLLEITREGEAVSMPLPSRKSAGRFREELPLLSDGVAVPVPVGKLKKGGRHAAKVA